MRTRWLLAGLAAIVAVAALAGPARRAPVARAATAPLRVAAVGDIACKDPPKNNRSV